MSNDSVSPQRALDAALSRAIKAEKAYLKLKYESYVEKMQNTTTSAEQEYAAKISLYSSLPDQQMRLKDEFQKRTHDINMRIDSAKEIYCMCIEALDKGLCMDDLPMTSTDTNQVRAIIQKLLSDKEFRNDGIEKMVPYGNIMTLADPNIVSNGHVPYPYRQQRTTNNPPTQRINSPIVGQRGVVLNNGSASPVQIQQVKSQQVTTSFPTPHQVHSTQTIATTLPGQYYTPTEQLHRFGPSQTANQGAVIQNQMFYAQHPNYANGRVAAAMNKPNVPVSQMTNNLGSTQRYVPAPQIPPIPYPVTSTSNAQRVLPTSQAAVASAVNDLDNFVIDDDMFSSETVPKQDDNIHNGAAPKPLEKTNKIINNLPAAKSADTMDSIDDVNSEDESKHSISDDEEFAARLTTRQGAVARTAQAAAKPKEVVKEPARKSDATGKADPANNDVDWTTEPWLNIVQSLLTKYKLNKTVTIKYLQTALQKVGDISKLDSVFAEAERSIQNAFRSNPLDQPAANPTPKTTESDTSSDTTKPAHKAEVLPRYSNYKTVMCEHWLIRKNCYKGESCTFAHGKGDLRPQPNASSTKPARNAFYKVILCRHHTAGYCSHGKECIFAHGKEELRQGNSDDAGKGNQGNGDDHPEPCNDQRCPGKLEFLLRKTGLCDKNKQGLCKFGKDCKFAHSKKELKTMPKWEMCERHQIGRCSLVNNPEKCVYAHSEKELKRKPADVVKPTGQATGGRLIPLGTRYVPWAGEDKHPTTPKDAEECSICMGPLFAAEKKKLPKCGHNSFHERCISQWVNEGMASCPICREPAQLPDMFQAPAGFQPEEFPGLGL